LFPISLGYPHSSNGLSRGNFLIMGSVRMGPPAEILEKLKSNFSLQQFIETGTYLGETTYWASQLFERVITIEYSKTLYENAIERYQQQKNIQFLFGDTRSRLREIVPDLASPSVFWLDAHWCGWVTYGETDECPLLEEIEIINQSDQDHFILIDDARLFLSPPPLPHVAQQWPDITEVLKALESENHRRYVVIFEDVIIAVPDYAKPLLINHLQTLPKLAIAQPSEQIKDPPHHLQPGELEIIEKFIATGQVIVDAGANKGSWSKAVLSRFADVQIHLFEPVPQVYQKLLQNLANEIKSGQLYLHNSALANQEVYKDFYYYENVSEFSTFHRRIETEKQYNLAPPKVFSTFATTLDMYTQRMGIKHIHFLKVDTEGSELDVLKGARRLLEKGKIDHLQFEYGETYLDSGITLEEVFNFLAQFSYTLFKITADSLVHLREFDPNLEDYQYSNFLAVNKSSVSRILGDSPRMLDLQQLCTQHRINPRGIIHVGAHAGLEAATYQAMGLKNVLFIEANPTVFQRLQTNLSSYPEMNAVNYAIGNTNGDVTLHITSMDQSSSILPLKLHREIYPNIEENAQIVVPGKTLDTLLEDLDQHPGDFNLLNIDIQGAELLALQGATGLLRYIDAINTEVNFQELYAGCALIEQIDQFLEQQGFRRVATTTPYHPSWGDAFYVRQPTIAMSSLGINGRFGNQFFQYAFLKSYAREHDLAVETSEWIGQFLFGTQDAQISQRRPVILEQTNRLDQALIPVAPLPYKNVDFWGYFQFHSRYYAPHKDYLQSLFKPAPEVEIRLRAGLNQLRANGQTLVGLHLRRGDYGSSIFPIAPNSWYLEWLRGFWETLEQPVLFIASDQPEKVIADFAAYHPITVADLGIELPEAEFYPDFYLLSQCDAVAISNSSFSYAACWLNEKAKFFCRPDFSAEKLIPFDPWNSDLWPQEIDNNLGVTLTLSYARKNLTKAWLEDITDETVKENYLGSKGTWQWIVQYSSLKDNPLSEADQALLDQIKSSLSLGLAGSGAIRQLLAMLLYAQIEDLCFIDPATLPAWLRTDYLQYLAWSREQAQLTRQALQTNLRLREINLILFPDWNQPEEILAQELFQVLQAIAQHPHRAQITLLFGIDFGNAPAIDLLISDLMMNILMTDQMDPGETDSSLEITLVSELSPTQWRCLLPLLRGKIALPHEFPDIPNSSLLTGIPTLNLSNIPF
jgi:FkbM family methyltransferase